MAEKTSKFVVGLFVTIGVLIGASAIVWLGASKYFQRGAAYVTYFDESVQGLSADSIVKYRGVEIGRIENIRVAPDNKLIEIVMKINLRGDLEHTTVTQLKDVGITGMKFIELDHRVPGEADLSPEIVFAAEYPIIPSRPSEIRQVFSKVDKIIEKIEAIDIQEISGQITSMIKSVNTFLTGPKLSNILSNLETGAANLDKTILDLDTLLTGPKMNTILSNVESVTTHLDKAVIDVEGIIAQGGLAEVLVEAKDTIIETRALVTSLKDKVTALKLAKTMETANEFIEGLGKRTHVIALEIRATSENLRQASETLERLMERLNASPSDLIYRSSPLPRRDQ